ncbi:MAG: hypothetical protein JO006_00140 [Paucibacter sp.]|nr:hypothetical protein [Roseateles sp.]
MCSSSVTARCDVLDKRLFAEVRDELLSPEALAVLQREVSALLDDVRRQAAGEAATAPRQLKVTEAEISRLLDAVAAVGINPAFQGQHREAETERERLAHLIEQAQSRPGQVIDAVMARYRHQVLDLQRVLEEDTDRDRARQLLADMRSPSVSRCAVSDITVRKW